MTPKRLTDEKLGEIRDLPTAEFMEDADYYRNALLSHIAALTEELESAQATLTACRNDLLREGMERDQYKARAEAAWTQGAEAMRAAAVDLVEDHLGEETPVDSIMALPVPPCPGDPE